MITLSPLRWGKPYESLDFIDVVHFDTGEPIAKIGTVGGGIVGRDMRQGAQSTRSTAAAFDRRVDRAVQASRGVVRVGRSASRRFDAIGR